MREKHGQVDLSVGRPWWPPIGQQLHQYDSQSTDAAPLDVAETSLLAKLKELRMRLAKQRRVPAFAIFPDRSLTDMAQRRPQTLNEFAEVNGVGAKKLKEFGEMFLAVIRDAS